MNKKVALYTKILCITIAFLLIFFPNIEVSAYTGETGYQVVVPSSAYPDLYVLTEHANDTSSKTFLPSGFYELNGKVVYLTSNFLETVSLIGGYFADENGSLTPYTEETKPAIDAHVNDLLQAKLSEAKTIYGIEFHFKPKYTNFENYHFVNGTLKLMNEYFPDGSVQIIANASASKTKKSLTFQQLKDENNDSFTFDGLMGTYNSQTNRINTYLEEIVVGHELGHAIESTLNTASGGQLRQTFKALNGEYDYSAYYYYSGNDSIYNSFYGGMSECVRRSYAATSFSEDFAETFSDALRLSTEELTIRVSKGEIGIPYFQKILYVKQLFNQYAGCTILQ